MLRKITLETLNKYLLVTCAHGARPLLIGVKYDLRAGLFSLG
jgi:hypothetical protein